MKRLIDETQRDVILEALEYAEQGYAEDARGDGSFESDAELRLLDAKARMFSRCAESLAGPSPRPELKFDEYVEQGKLAVQTHPDLHPDGVDFETAAKDTIANILHALYGRASYPNCHADAEALLQSALFGFRGDYEDLRLERKA